MWKGWGKMEIREGIHQIRIDFNVTEEVRRYVYVYLVTGRECYLIDSGVAGSEGAIAGYLQGIGRSIEDIKGIFLTHAHPDHIGSAAKIKEMSGCRVYASEGERSWIEGIDLQFWERPIPNFYRLAGASVKVDQVVKSGDVLELEPGLEIKVVGSNGHSMDDVSYWIPSRAALFTGDSIPAEHDIPIYIDRDLSTESLSRLREIPSVEHYCPAWDRIYIGEEGRESIDKGIQLIGRIQQEVEGALKGQGTMDDDMLIGRVCDNLGMRPFLQNPLFKRTVLCHRV